MSIGFATPVENSGAGEEDTWRKLMYIFREKKFHRTMILILGSNDAKKKKKKRPNQTDLVIAGHESAASCRKLQEVIQLESSWI